MHTLENLRGYSHLESLNDELPTSCKVAIYGTGQRGKEAYSFLTEKRGDVSVVCFVDSYSKGHFQSLDIITPDELQSRCDYDLIIICSTYSEQIVGVLRFLGIQNFIVCSGLGLSENTGKDGVNDSSEVELANGESISHGAILEELLSSNNAYNSFLGAHENLEGWFSPTNAVVWNFLLNLQRISGIEGDILEVGVFKGKSAFLLSKFAQFSCSKLTLCDIKLSTSLETLLHKMEADGIDVEFIQGKSQDVAALGKFPSSLRFFHIDGAHDFESVYEDMRIAERSLDEYGIIAMDDVFNFAFPQVTEAMFAYLSKNQGRLSVFMLGDNKAYLCRSDKHSYYRDLCDRFLVPVVSSHIAKTNFQLRKAEGQNQLISKVDGKQCTGIYFHPCC